MAGKGSKRRIENYEAILKNWDDIFGHNDLEIEPINFKHTNTCNHCVSNSSMVCKFCGKSVNNIQNDGDSFYMEG